MKLGLPFLLQTLLCAASTTALPAQVYVSGHKVHHRPNPISISPSTARLIFAQRLDVAQYHSLGDVDADDVELVNDFGGRPRKLFGDDEDRYMKRLLFVVEGADKPENFICGGLPSAFNIDTPPNSEANVKLLSDFKKQIIASAEEEAEKDEHIYDFWTTLPLAESGILSTTGARAVAHSQSLEQISNKHGPSSPEYKSASAAIRDTIAQLLAKSATDKSWDVTVVFMPSKPSGSIFKRSKPSSWGKYSMPAKRQLDETNVEDVPERPQVVDDTESDTSSHSLLSDIEDFAASSWNDLISSRSSPLSSLAQDTTPPLGILPACYSTLTDCITTTHNCSGHGTCLLKYTDQSAPSGGAACYGCGCRATRYELDEGGTQITYWAGPACQKVDVSTEFWLIGGTVLGLFGAVVWGVGLLYGMGAQELPSVLGAGVASPRAK